MYLTDHRSHTYRDRAPLEELDECRRRTSQFPGKLILIPSAVNWRRMEDMWVLQLLQPYLLRQFARVPGFRRVIFVDEAWSNLVRVQVLIYSK